MKKEENKVDFDLSVLTLAELIKVYQSLLDFLEFLSEKRIVTEEGGK